ncbi:hypothetical protein EW146_g9363 [Bondarzewia mesenterica]|uniref:Uncharacterized protein n=1 Tax=Bondarzewia mesenterica TaxID=1095465 RepID=A0A4S4L796_9AGAM|nr:hypothetical protein EW146_g9363 [Bondarzewia mesenterica]
MLFQSYDHDFDTDIDLLVDCDNWIAEKLFPTDHSIDDAVTALDAKQLTEAKPYIVEAKTPTGEGDIKRPTSDSKLSMIKEKRWASEVNESTLPTSSAHLFALDYKLLSLSVKLSISDDIAGKYFASSVIQQDGGMHLIGNAESPVEEGKPLLGIGRPSYVHRSTSHKDVEGLLAVGFDFDYTSLMASLMTLPMDLPETPGKVTQ